MILKRFRPLSPKAPGFRRREKPPPGPGNGGGGHLGSHIVKFCFCSQDIEEMLKGKKFKDVQLILAVRKSKGQASSC